MAENNSTYQNQRQNRSYENLTSGNPMPKKESTQAKPQEIILMDTKNVKNMQEKMKDNMRSKQDAAGQQEQIDKKREQKKSMEKRRMKTKKPKETMTKKAIKSALDPKDIMYTTPFAPVWACYKAYQWFKK